MKDFLDFSDDQLRAYDLARAAQLYILESLVAVTRTQWIACADDDPAKPLLWDTLRSYDRVLGQARAARVNSVTENDRRVLVAHGRRP